MYYSKKLCVHIKKSFSLFLAFTMMLSVCAISGMSLNVSAATNLGNYYLITTANSEWQNQSVAYRIYDSSLNTVKSGTANASGSGDVYLLPSAGNGVRLEFSVAPFTLPDKAVKSGYTRIFFSSKSVVSKDGTYNYSNPYIHYYSGSSASQTDTTWPGEQMTKVSASSDIYYADIPQGYKKLNFCDWDTTDKYAVHQTTDQTIAYYNGYAYYSDGRWQNPRISSIDISSATAAQDSVYMDKDANLVLSKFSYDGSGVDKKPVYVYNDNWKSQSKIYATYSLVGAVLSDSNLTYTVTTELTAENVNGYIMFKGEIPVDTNICFHINADNLKGGSNITQYGGGTGTAYSSTFDDNTATYKMLASTENWMKRSDVNNTNYDAVIGNSFAKNANIVGVDATYFDYWSDNEQSEGYLNNESYGSGIENYWYQFDNYNDYISKIAKNHSTDWKYPLYFGNMFKGDEWYNTFENHVKNLTNINDYKQDYYYAVNNSNGMKNGNVVNYNQSLMGLVYNKLDSNGDLQVINGVKAPYFDANTLLTEKYNGKKVASVYKSSFPFRTETDSNGVTKYSFSSKNAKDNIYFTWDGTNPKQINYGAGEYYGVHDNLKNFGGTANGYGIFPFNTNSNTKTSSAGDRIPPTPADGDFYIQTSNSQYTLWLFNNSSDGHSVTVTDSKTIDGVKYLVVHKSDYDGYANCVLKPNASDSDWTGKSNDLLVSELLNYGVVTTAGKKYDGPTYTRGGNDELDYGFGIRLDIDFRVPENGKIADGEDVKFNFTGDDDIWVYIGEDSTGADADLVLDLGGDHKETNGNINFATMQATATDVYANYSVASASSAPSVGANQLCMQSSTDKLYAYIWGNGVTAKTVEMTQKVVDGVKFYYLDLDNYSGCTQVIFKSTGENDWTNKTNDLEIASYKGKILKWENKAGYNPAEYSASTSHATNLGTVTKSFNNGKNLDPNKTYHMVVFYMERGEAESNLSIDFTMTPANNDLTVNKYLDTADTVTEIANDLRANETYDYTITDGDNAKGKNYKLNGVKSALGNNGSFVLKDSDNAEFENTFKTGSDITVNESISSPLSYTTSWELVNKKNGLIIDNADSANSNFILKDYDDESASALLELDYVNKIKTSKLTLTKKTADEDGNDYQTDRQFDFKLLIDLDGSGTKYEPKAYPVKYVVGGKTYSATQEGIITVGAGETVEITGLPVGASYTLYEQTASGFLPLMVSDSTGDHTFSGTYSSVVGESGNTLVVTNKLNPVESGIVVGKTLDGLPYTGSKFNYTLNGLPTMTTSYTDDLGDFAETLDTSQTNIAMFNVQDGRVVFDNLSFDRVGYYRYYISESYTRTDTDEEKAVYNIDNRLFLVEVSVTANGSDLVVSEPAYSVVNADKAQEFIDADTNAKNAYFTNDSTEAAFENTTNKASITVNKSDQSDKNIADTQFALIKVSGENVFDSSDLSNVIADIKSNPARATLGSTDALGNVVFGDLLVYQNGTGCYTKENNSLVWKDNSDNYVSGNQTKQVYCLFEYSPSAGYNPTGVINYYTFPIYNTQTNQYQFDVTVSYVDGAVLMPNASGSGMNVFFVIGFILLGLGATVVLSYTVYDNVQRKKRKAGYMRRS